LSPEKLAERILQIQRLAAGGHLPGYVWQRVDQMRSRLRFQQRTDQRIAEAKANARRRPRAPISLAPDSLVTD
jgi:hypothetical protein